MDEDAPVCAKVADFGLARSITSGISGSLQTWQWLAPEVILEDGGEYDISSDVYSFGVVLWELVSFQFPYDEFDSVPRYSRTIVDGNGNKISMINPSDLKYAIIHDQLRPTIPKDCPTDYANLIERCWHQNTKKRPTFDEIVYILSVMLDVKLADVSFDSVTFCRKNIPVDLGKELTKLHTEAIRQSKSDFKDAISTFASMVPTGDRFVSCMVHIKDSPEVWTGNSNGSIVIRHSVVSFMFFFI